MIWVLLWALGVVALLVFFFRGYIRWFFLWLVTLVVVIAGAFLGHALMERPGYRHFVEAATRMGWHILIVAVTVLVADHLKGKVATENRPLRRA